MEDKKTVKIEPTSNENLLKGVSACFRELEVLRKDMVALLAAQQNLAKREPIDSETQYKIKEMEAIITREQEDHMWERSLPLCSESTDHVITAIAAVKAKGVELTATGSSGRDEAIAYDDLLVAFQKPLAQQGINIQSLLIPGYYSTDDDILKTELRHKESSQFVASYSKIRVSLVSSNIVDPLQKRSCAISYAKRHNLQALLGL